jgi:hypothetical protein
VRRTEEGDEEWFTEYEEGGKIRIRNRGVPVVDAHPNFASERGKEHSVLDIIYTANDEKVAERGGRG